MDKIMIFFALASILFAETYIMIKIEKIEKHIGMKKGKK